MNAALRLLWTGLLLTSTLRADWVLQESGTRVMLHSVHFHSEDSGYVCGEAGTLLRTTNRGATWTPVATGAKDTALLEVLFLDSREGLVLGESGYLARTEDGGRTWIRIAPGGGGMLMSLGWNGGGKVFVGNLKGAILVSPDAGRSWSPASVQGLDTTGIATQYHFPSPDLGYATSSHGILKTEDAGRTWNLALSSRSPEHPSGVVLTSLFFLSPTEGLVAGPYYSTIAKTADGARTFSKVSMAAANKIFFPTRDTGYAACHAGKIFRSVDRGATWALHQDIGREAVILSGLHFPGPASGFAVGDSGAIYHYRGAPGSALRGSLRRGSGGRLRMLHLYDSLGKKGTDGSGSPRIRFRPR
jgi:photosystem II stability/assembly factor-like uncharacterized protein